jgi:hypothetical protein
MTKSYTVPLTWADEVVGEATVERTDEGFVVKGTILDANGALVREILGVGTEYFSLAIDAESAVVDLDCINYLRDTHPQRVDPARIDWATAQIVYNDVSSGYLKEETKNNE